MSAALFEVLGYTAKCKETIALTMHRANAALPEVMDGWFKRVESLFNETELNGLSSKGLKCHLWNCDETGCCAAAAAKKKILAKQGDQDVHETIGGSGREQTEIVHYSCVGTEVMYVISIWEVTFMGKGYRNKGMQK